MARIVAGVMGPGETDTAAECALADRLGELVAGRGWVVLIGGRPVGVMESALAGAKRAGGLTIGVLPHETDEPDSAAADSRIVTGMGEARNVVNVLTSHIVFVCGMSPGTAGETALAIKKRHHVILLELPRGTADFWGAVGGSLIHTAATPDEALELRAPARLIALRAAVTAGARSPGRRRRSGTEWRTAA